jgi:hypothetical protein
MKLTDAPYSYTSDTKWDEAMSDVNLELLYNVLSPDVVTIEWISIYS